MIMGPNTKEQLSATVLSSNGPKFVLLNDTRDQHHFGCYCVINTIHKALLKRGAHLLGTSLTGSHWEKSSSFLKKLRDCDAVLINGEGTLHHGNPRAERLLKVVNHPLRGKKPVFIINALYQDNPIDWGQYLEKVAFIGARDSRSFRELEKVYSGQLVKTLDLSLYNSFDQSSTSRFLNYIVYGDSVFPEITKKLVSLSCKQEKAVCIPIMTGLKSRKANLIQPLRSFRDGYIKAHRELSKLFNSNLYFASDATEYLSHLANSRLHITGRFHGACLSLLVGTPTLVTTSNSWKTEALIEDIGLSEKRLVTIEELEQLDPSEDTYSFSQLELDNLENALSRNHIAVDSAFDQIISITQSRP